jgi:hypothetical protein
MIKVIKIVERYLTPNKQLFIKDVPQEISEENFEAIPEKDKVLFEDHVAEEEDNG